MCGFIVVFVNVGLWLRVAFVIRISLGLRVEILLRLLAEVLV